MCKVMEKEEGASRENSEGLVLRIYLKSNGKEEGASKENSKGFLQ